MPQDHHPRSEVWTGRRAGHALPEQRVLVVDDYIDTADALCTSLLVHGFDARAAYGGCEALQIAAAWRPHTIVLDVAMPDLSGLAVATAVRQIPALADCLLVAYTAQAETDYEVIRESGFDALCAKPASPKWLVRLLEALAMPTGDKALPIGVHRVC
nr:Alkaline phosphatase synthesis transcriptional regulatory protein PhoP [Paraburkholderia busanensis]